MASLDHKPVNEKSSIFGDLVVMLKISKLQNCSELKTRAAALAILNYEIKHTKVT